MSLDDVLTEAINPDTREIDSLPTIGILEAINREDQGVAEAVTATLPVITQVVDSVVNSFQRGGRLFYMGAGSSGRVGVVDAAECPPTYGTNPETIQGLMAGGTRAVFAAVEGAEDDESAGKQDLMERNLTANDIVIGIAASGRTPYVLGGLRYASIIGATTVALVAAPESPMEKIASHTIATLTGPEVINGSTRMKAGTAHKMVLNMISTASMVKLGKVYGNLMVDFHASNFKLRERAKRVVSLATGVSREESEEALRTSSGSVKVAIMILLTGTSLEASRKLLQASGGFLRQALNHYWGKSNEKTD